MFGTTGYAAILAKVAAPDGQLGPALGRGLRGRDLDAQHAARDARRRAHQAGLLGQHDEPGGARRRESSPHRAEAPRAQVRLDQHAAQHRPGTAAHALLGRRRRPRDQGHPAGERRSTSCPARATSSGPTASPSPRRPRTSTRRTSSSTTCSTPKQAGQAADYIGYHCVVPEGVQYYTDPMQVEMRPTAEQIANGKLAEDVGEFQAMYDEAWRTSSPATALTTDVTGAGRRGRTGGRGARRRQEGTEWNRPSAPDLATARSSR